MLKKASSMLLLAYPKRLANYKNAATEFDGTGDG
jgi:hypothetical protein